VDPAPQPHQLGEFHILSVLGEGGSGVVYDATWGPRRVALKVLRPALVGTGKERAQFLTEAQRLQQIMHPSVVKVLAVGQLPDGRPYLAMERLDGETLASVIARGALSLARALEMFGELASAVHALHEQGLVHRDLKPENVFVVADRHAVLLDFGIAKDLDAPASTTTQEGSVRGTPAYMAPERFFGQPAGIATDVYELALVLYVMLAGRLPWDHVADPEARLAPRSLCELAPVPEALDVEIRRALSTRAQNRPASALALLDTVRAAASDFVTEPEPQATARLRSAAQLAVTTSGGEPSRAPSAATQSSPLPWAPTQAAPTARRRHRAWPVVAALAGAAAVAVALVLALSSAVRDPVVRDPAVRISANDAGEVAVGAGDAHAAGDDPWGKRHREAAEPAALVADARTLEQYRVEAAASIATLARTTRVIFAVQLAELRAHGHTRDFLDKLTSQPKVAALGILLPACVKRLVSDAEWIVVGSPSLDKSTEGTLIVRGRWQRADVESCFGASAKPHLGKDGAKLFRVGDDGWLDFLDDHTAYVALATKLDAEAVHRLVTKRAGPAPKVKQKLAALPAERTISIVVDGATGDDWSMFSLPKGTDVYGWIRVEPQGIALDLAADPHTVAAAAAAEARIKPELATVFEHTTKEGVGRLEVARAGTAVHVHGTITALMVGIVTASLTL